MPIAGSKLEPKWVSINVGDQWCMASRRYYMSLREFVGGDILVAARVS